MITDQLFQFRAQPPAVLGQLTQPSFDSFFPGQVVRWYVGHIVVDGRDTFRRGRNPSPAPTASLMPPLNTRGSSKRECAAIGLTSFGGGSGALL